MGVCCRSYKLSQDKLNTVTADVTASYQKFHSSILLPAFHRTIVVRANNQFPTIKAQISPAINNRSISKKTKASSTRSITSVVSRKRTQSAVKKSIFFNRTSISVIILGSNSTGKTSYIERVKDDSFQEIYKQSTDNEEYNLKGNLNTRNYNVYYYSPYDINSFDFEKNVDFFYVFIDSTNKESFNYAKELYSSKLTSKNMKLNGVLSTVIFIKTKIDLEDANNNFINEIEMYCKENAIDLFEMSLKTKVGFHDLNDKVVEVFDSEKLNEKIEFVD